MPVAVVNTVIIIPLSPKSLTRMGIICSLSMMLTSVVCCLFDLSVNTSTYKSVLQIGKNI